MTDSTHPPAPHVSVIIPVFNDAERLSACLDALAQQTLPQSSFEVIVVDNGSVDDVRAVFDRHPSVLPAHEPRRGSYAARNRGLEIARADAIAFTDSDCIPATDWLESGLAALDADSNVGLVAGAIHVFPRDPRHPTAVELYESLHAFPQERYASDVGFGATANVFTRRSVIELIGPFDPSLKSGGDMEWGTRLARHRLEVRYAPDVIVRHPARANLRELGTKLNRVVVGDQALKWGGEAQTTRTYVRELARTLVPPFGVTLRALRDRRLPTFGQRVRYAGVRWYIRYATAWSLIRGTRRARRGAPAAARRQPL